MTDGSSQFHNTLNFENRCFMFQHSKGFKGTSLCCSKYGRGFRSCEAHPTHRASPTRTRAVLASASRQVLTQLSAVDLLTLALVSRPFRVAAEEEHVPSGWESFLPSCE